MTKRYIKLCCVNRNLWKKSISLTWTRRDACLQFFSIASLRDGHFRDSWLWEYISLLHHMNVVELDSMKINRKMPFKNRRMRPWESSFQETQRQCRSTKEIWQEKEPPLSSWVSSNYCFNSLICIFRWIRKMSKASVMQKLLEC